MRLHLLAAAALTVAAASPVFAQDAPAASPHQPSAPLSQPSPSAPKGPAANNTGAPINGGIGHSTPGAAGAAVGSQSPVSGTVADMPSSWAGSANDWSTHTAACSKAYPNYSPSTDTFTAPSGRSEKCMMGMGSAKKK